MSSDRYAPRPLSRQEPDPFASAEEAWLWYCQNQIARLEGVRFDASAKSTPRPCDPDDIYRAVDRLYRARLLDRRHLVVLADYGSRLAAPSPRLADETVAARLWDEALDRLTTPLKTKGIVL
jgi:hypothetical protein